MNPGKEFTPSNPHQQQPSFLNNNQQQLQASGGSKATSKSDMCLINELVRGLNIRHEYRLVSESGPAHKKCFTVNLKLGDLESYEGSGPSIKKAQQAAASRALKETKLSHNLQSRKKRSTATPTVELNVYAMKQGIQVSYVVNEPRILIPDSSIGNPVGGGGVPKYSGDHRSFPCCPCPSNCVQQQLSRAQSTHSSSSSSCYSPCHQQQQSQPSYSGHGHSKTWNNGQSQSWPSWNLRPGQRYMSTTTDMYEAIVTVGSYQYYGSGRTPQGARHAAAQAALDSIYSSSSGGSVYGGSSSYCSGYDDGSSQASTSSMSSSVSTIDGQSTNNQRPVIVSLIKRASELNLSVNFQVVQNLGPSHLPTFVTQCTAGRFVVQSQGHSKKESKKRAATDMLALLNQIKIVPNRQIAPSHGQMLVAAAMTAPTVIGPMVPNGHVQVLNGGVLTNGQVIQTPPPMIPTHSLITSSSPVPIIPHTHVHHVHHVHGVHSIPNHVQQQPISVQHNNQQIVQSIEQNSTDIQGINSTSHVQ